MAVDSDRKSPPSIYYFVGIMIAVVAVQGTYLGYFVGMLTTLEKRFGISSEPSGSLLSIYDIGHTVAILAIGYFGEKAHQPKITAIGKYKFKKLPQNSVNFANVTLPVLLSSLSMFVLALPALFFGTLSDDDIHQSKYRERYIMSSQCDENRFETEADNCSRERAEHTTAFLILSLGQLLAGVFSAPFNTLAYVYIDNNLDDRRRSPFILGLLTSMYAFAPAFGFALAAGLNQVYTSIGDVPDGLVPSDEEWIGAWWLGFLICGVLYLFAAFPIFCFPQTYVEEDGMELQALRHKTEKRPHLPVVEDNEDTGCTRLKKSMSDFPLIVSDLLRNPVYVSMVLGWMFGSYLIAGYGTYLPKYIETQFGRSASLADVYAGVISIGAVAFSTAIGGWVLSRSNVGPRPAILLLALSWIIVVAAYLLGMLFSCPQAEIHGLEYLQHEDSWEFRHHHSCSSHCMCSAVTHFDPVNYDGVNYFSPCHAGCRNYAYYQWRDCDCFDGQDAYHGVVHSECSLALGGYIAVMFIGLFLGNLFFMTTMMIVLRSVYDDQKVVALSFASCITNLLGFMPAPLFLGWLIDKSCIMWSSTCPDARGNCVVYNNERFRIGFHTSNAVLQTLGVICVVACWIFARKQRFPEEEDDDEVVE